MSSLIYDLQDEYEKTFGTRPALVAGVSTPPPGHTVTRSEVLKSALKTDGHGSELLTSYAGREIWLPTRFWGLPASIAEGGMLFLPYTVVKVSCKKTIVKTAMAERRGTVKEQYSTEDYVINMKGFVIDNNRIWPYKELTILKKLFELNRAVGLSNALTDIFIGRNDKVVIESIDLPEVEGGRNHVRPFSMQLESDTIFTLEAK